MNFSATPPTARTDLHSTPRPHSATPRHATIRTGGVAMAIGAATWAVGVAIVGFKPDSEAGIRTNDLTGLVFQCGLLALVHVHVMTRATGTKRRNRWMLEVERVLLVCAIAWTLSHALLPTQRDATWMSVLDFSWPLSMLGMFLIGVTIALKGRWRGAPRAWALIAETWAIVTIPALGVLGDAAGTAVGVAHLLLGYAVLGLLLAARPDLVDDVG